MSPTSPTLIITALACLLAGPSFSQTAEEENKAISLARQQAERYAEHFNRADAELLSALFNEDASYTTSAGLTLTGRPALLESAKQFFSGTDGASIAIVVDSARFLTPNVIVDRGVATVTTGEASESTRFSTTHVNQDGEWLIADLQEAELPAADPATEALGRLSWMIGTWKTDTAEMEATWTLDGQFITRTSRIPRDDDFLFVSVEVIGFDPINQRLRSWIFDNEGGFGEGLWREDENKWLISTKAIMPGGGHFSAEHVVTRLEEGKVALDSINRMLDGEALPNRDRIIVERASETREEPAAP